MAWTRPNFFGAVEGSWTGVENLLGDPGEATTVVAGNVSGSPQLRFLAPLCAPEIPGGVAIQRVHCGLVDNTGKTGDASYWNGVRMNLASVERPDTPIQSYPEIYNWRGDTSWWDVTDVQFGQFVNGSEAFRFNAYSTSIYGGATIRLSHGFAFVEYDDGDKSKFADVSQAAEGGSQNPWQQLTTILQSSDAWPPQASEFAYFSLSGLNDSQTIRLYNWNGRNDVTGAKKVRVQCMCCESGGTGAQGWTIAARMGDGPAAVAMPSAADTYADVDGELLHDWRMVVWEGDASYWGVTEQELTDAVKATSAGAGLNLWVNLNNTTSSRQPRVEYVEMFVDEEGAPVTAGGVALPVLF